MKKLIFVLLMLVCTSLNAQTSILTYPTNTPALTDRFYLVIPPGGAANQRSPSLQDIFNGAGLNLTAEVTPVAGDYVILYDVSTSTTKRVLCSDLTKALTAASATLQGVVTTGTQTIAGNKTFNGSVTVGTASSISPSGISTFTGISSTGDISAALGSIYGQRGGSFNLTLGQNAMFNVIGGAAANVSCGTSSLFALTTGDSNNGFGYGTLEACTTGSQNIAIGESAGNDIVTGSRNIFIGHFAGSGGETGSDKLYIDPTNTTTPLIHGDFSTNVITINGSLIVGTGNTAISGVLTNTAALDFPSTNAATISDLTITVTGAALGDTVSIGVPNGSITATGSYFGWVSATNTVTIRFMHIAAGSEDPASGTFRVTVTKF